MLAVYISAIRTIAFLDLSWLIRPLLSPSEPEPLIVFDCLELEPFEFLGLCLAEHTVCRVGGDTGGDRLVKRRVTPFKPWTLSPTAADDGETNGLATLCPPVWFVPWDWFLGEDFGTEIILELLKPFEPIVAFDEDVPDPSPPLRSDAFRVEVSKFFTKLFTGQFT